ncbi:MAG: lamin tail domain-containing protein [Saprospiraceae bacterium]|nr:lamin tail domain-containing protein [Saprospiraceae bacterium]
MHRVLSFLTAIVLLTSTGVRSQIVITEIMYNPPESGQDSLEFIELYNNSGSTLNLTDYTFDQGIQFTFPQFLLEPEGYVVICTDTTILENLLGITQAFQFESGALSNGGEDIIILDAQGNIVDVVDYENGGDWPIEANGEGSSLELCDVDRDNADPANWKASESAKGIVINGRELKATPNGENQVSCADHTVMVFSNYFDPDTLTINLGETVEWICVEGNHNVNGTLATFPDNPEGFTSGAPENAPWSYSHTFEIEGNYNYRCDPHFLLGMVGYITVEDNQPIPLIITEIMYNDPGSDSLEFIEIYNGSDVPIQLDGYRMINAIDHLFPDMMIPEQSFLVLARDKGKVDAAFGINSIQWDEGQLNNSGEAIELIDPQGNSIDRVDYESESPWDDRADGTGRSLILCELFADNNAASNWSVSNNSTGVTVSGLDIFANPGGEDECEVIKEIYPLRSIADVTTVDADGLPDSLGVQCALQGIVYGVDLQGGNNIQFTLIDQTGGIGVFSTDNFNYTVTEGDELVLKGSIDQLNGLTRINPDSLKVISSGNTLSPAREITELNESTESEFVVVDAQLNLVDVGQWDDSGSSFNFEVTDGTNNYSVRIDSDTDIAGRPAPTDPFRLFGLGGQFDTSEPYTSGYQLLPRYYDDFDFSVAVDDERLLGLEIIPNPVRGILVVKGWENSFRGKLMDLHGQEIAYTRTGILNLSDLNPGLYVLGISASGGGAIVKKIIKQ